MNNPSTDTPPPPPLKRNSNDVGWEYGLLCDPRVPEKVRCRLCGKEFSGGVYGMKEHIGHLNGNVSACPMSSKEDQEKCKNSIMEAKEKKNKKRKHEEAIRAEVNINKNSNVEELEKELGPLKAPHFQVWARVDTSYSVSVKEPLLNEEKQRTKEKLKALEEEWDREGCSVMTNSWTDMKRRSIMNLCVNSRGGTCFLSSKDASKDSHTGEYIFNYIDKCIEDLEAEKVVQVVTDNATNKVAAANLLKEKRPRVFWTGCAAHTMDLMLEGISKLHGFAKVIEQAKAVTIFVYAHHTTL
ncbi:uncharacterized protein LOC106373734 [Brassica napus]|uniref:uncharacterized protein LOC106373734 n=1 Tax=Brassica napus TaxID=3708 RepID=UPI0006AB08B5|nr:uncharacterized protein LOC106373734 [Brassica napus]